ncbi:Oidioi.mRNA.OKI2018_I69.chr2.g6783.t1.cds [Oikopleura dioica]|uniref:Oidioi.mRNA.OKI2018_I69.chr2.g6783.t1.cds n=1 Tax=Oikopleura dioica TaxID=34765 RepID=A0ABN7T8W9_OIKDI|nr:Oidioi.mRNA.OKI2018_I69.chr2.g6783.t1.cds [Oikopleura dioica]
MKIACLIASALAKRRFDDDKVVSFDNLTVSQIHTLKTFDRVMNFDFWSPESVDELVPGGTADIHVSQFYANELEDAFRAADFEYKLTIQNLQEQIDIETMFSRNHGKAHDLLQYNDYDTIKSYSQSFAGYFTYGSSFEGRDLFGVKIGTGSKVISVDCGIHAREWISPAYCQWFMNEAKNGQFNQYLSDVTFIVMPSINPDGYAYTWNSDRMWRKNRATGYGGCVGVDLNRNYDANHAGEGASPNPCSNTYHGPSAFSEPEAKAQQIAMQPYIDDGNLKAFLTVHSYGQYLIFPYSYDYASQAPNKAELQEVGDEMAAAIREVHQQSYLPGQDILYVCSGVSSDWAYDAMLSAGNSGPLAYTFELRDEGRFGFLLPAEQIQLTCEEIDAAMHKIINYVIENK